MRCFGMPDEAGSAIAFLLSDDATFISGQTLHFDGGASIGKSNLLRKVVGDLITNAEIITARPSC